MAAVTPPNNRSAAEQAAAEQLAAALTDPAMGPRVLRGQLQPLGIQQEGDSSDDDDDEDNNNAAQQPTIPAFLHICRALTPESALRELELCLGETGGDGAAAAALSEAIASGRARLERLLIANSDMTAGEGCGFRLLVPVRGS